MGQWNRSRWSCTVAGAIALTLLSYPLLRPWSDRFDGEYLRRVEQRPPAPWPPAPWIPTPGTPATDWLDRETYRQLERALDDRLPFRGGAVQLRAQWELLGRDRFDQVDVGRDRWLFYRLSYGLQETADSDHYTRDRVSAALDHLDQFLAWHRSTGAADVRLAIVPSKHAIYPEFLPPLARRDLQSTAAARDRLYGGIAQRHQRDRRVLDWWQIYRRGRQTLPDRLYLPLDSHHSSRGACLAIAALWQAWDPAIAASAQVFPRPGETYGGGDLRFMLGLRKRFTPWQVLPDTHDRVFEIRRPGIAAHGIWIDGQRYPNARTARDRNAIGNQYISAILEHRSTGPPLLPGRTLLLRDSFLDAKTWDNLGRGFRTLHVRHIHRIDDRALKSAFFEYDRIILQVAERNALRLLERLPTTGQRPRLPPHDRQGHTQPIRDRSAVV